MRPSFPLIGVLALTLTLPSAAQERGEPGRDGGSTAEEPVTIRGTVAGVTVVGETIISPETNRTAIAQASFLTVVGLPYRDPARDGPRKHPEETPGLDAIRGGPTEPLRAAGVSRANVYLIAITPRTAFYEAEPGGPESREGRGRARSSFERIELGDRIEVELILGTSHRRPGDDSHGRARTFPGEATSITILPAGPEP